MTDENVLIGNTPSATCPEEITNLVDLVDAMFNGNIYVNVHTVANPDGEVRGQLFPFSDIATVSVSSRSAWQDTGVAVATGDLLEIIASGSVRWDTAGHKSDPDGLPDSGLTSCSNSVVPGAPKHTLVGRIGASGSLAVDPTDFLVGSSFSQTATQSGNLFMAFNDCFVLADRSGLDSGGVGDNSGAYQAKILVTSP